MRVWLDVLADRHPDVRWIAAAQDPRVVGLADEVETVRSDYALTR